MRIVVDTRERKPYEFPGIETVEKKLDVGDYSVEGFEDVFAVERKSLNDFTRSVGTDRERFEREIVRGQSLNEFAVVIEADRADAEAGDYYSGIHPNAVLGTVDQWPLKYGTLDFEWAGDRARGAQLTLRLLDRWHLIAASDLL